jgi:hypothetical protein
VICALAFDRNLYWNAHLKAPFPPHKSPNSPETRLRAFNGQRFVEHKMCAHFESTLQPYRRFDQHNRQCAFVDRGGLCRAQNADRIRYAA